MKYIRNDLELRKNDLIARYVTKWGDNYDYSNINFVNMSKHITIRCKKHDHTYSQIARTHLKYNGCPKCYTDNQSLTKENFLERAKVKHGDKFDYSNVEFKNATDKVELKCNKCGAVFHQRVSNHLRGQGCRACIDNKKRKHATVIVNDTTGKLKAAFIDKAILKYGKVYDYSKVVYKGLNVPVTIICQKHGEFTVSPHTHLRPTSNGCIKCHNNRTEKRDEFIRKAQELHGHIYNYKYIDLNDKYLKIYCTVHKEVFHQRSVNHLRYSGCKKCIHDAAITDLDTFIVRANKKWDGKFDYSKAVYVTNDVPLTIICPEHGEFTKLPYDHLRRTGGCQICTASSSEQDVFRYFKKLGVNNVREKKFDPYVYKYDFYLPDNNILIECHGEQHFKPVEHWGGLQALIRNKVNDAAKVELAKELNIPLITITYKDFKNIEEKITTELKKHYKYLYKTIYYVDFEALCASNNLVNVKRDEYKKYLLI